MPSAVSALSKSTLARALAALAVILLIVLAVVGAISLARGPASQRSDLLTLPTPDELAAPVDLDNAWYLLGGNPLHCTPTTEFYETPITPDEFVAMAASRAAGAKIIRRSENMVFVATAGDPDAMVFLRGLSVCEAEHIRYLKSLELVEQ